jgi:hypothetical protein
VRDQAFDECTARDERGIVELAHARVAREELRSLLRRRGVVRRQDVDPHDLDVDARVGESLEDPLPDGHAAREARVSRGGEQRDEPCALRVRVEEVAQRIDRTECFGPDARQPAIRSRLARSAFIA